MPKSTRFQWLAAALVSCVAILSFGSAPTFAQRSPVDPGNSNNASACATCAYYAVDNSCSYTQQTVQGTQVSLVFVSPANAQAPNCVPRLVDNCPPSGGGSTPPGIEAENQKWKMFGTRLRNIATNQGGQGDIYLGYRDLGNGNGRQQYGTGNSGNQLLWATGSYSVKFQYDPVADTVKTFLGNINTATLTSFSSTLANRACTGCTTEQCSKCTLATINSLEVYLSNSGVAPAQIQLSNIKINGSPASPAALSIQQQPGFGTFYPLSGITSGLTVELDMNLNRNGMSGGAESVKVEIQVGCNLDKSTAPYCS